MGLQPLGLQLPLLLELAYFPFQTGLQEKEARLDSQKKKFQLTKAERIDDALRTASGEVYHWTITALQLLVLMLCPLATYPS